TGIATSFTWTVTGDAVGNLAASGSGPISFHTLNGGILPLVATVSVTPHYSNNSVDCINGVTKTFTITVNPVPTVDKPSDQIVCNNGQTADVHFTGAVNGTVYNWTNNNTSIGLAASGNTDIAHFTAVNTSNIPVTATITITPSYTNNSVTCAGTPQS